MKESYEHFCSTPGLYIVDIKEKLDTLENITVNFVYHDQFIGEMQFRYKELPQNYHANHFVYEVERAGANIEILEAFNKQAKYMSRHDELEYEVRGGN